jgi:hypothetical protein
MRLLLLLAPLLVAVGCRNELLVIPTRLAPGGGGAGAGGQGTVAQPQLNIVVRMQEDSTAFNPYDLMQIVVNGTDLARDSVMSGWYAVLSIAPAPAGTMQVVELRRRIGEPLLDTYTFDVVAYTGPTITSVTPNQARENTQVTIAGTGFSTGGMRIFFGGVEGAISTSSGTSITATVPVGALPGLVYVLVGTNAAEGVVGFQPLDAQDVRIPAPTTVTLSAAFPATGLHETAITLYAYGMTGAGSTAFNNYGQRVVGVATINVDPIGDIVTGFGVVPLGAEQIPGTVRIDEPGVASNELPFVVIPN